MANLDDLQKLNDLKNQGIISQEDFDKKKADILNNLTPQPTEGKSQAIYCVLALFTGCLGIHNFYAGRWKRGLTQLLLTLFSIFTLFLSLIIVEIWVIVNVFAIHTDGQGKEFIPSKTAKYICGFIMLAYFLFIFVSILAIGGIAGYTMAMNRHKANQALDMATKTVIAAQLYNGTGLTDGESKTALDLGLDTNSLDIPAYKIIVTNNNGIFEVQLGITDPTILHGIEQITGSSDGALIKFDEMGIVRE